MEAYQGSKHMYPPYDTDVQELDGRQGKRTNMVHDSSSEDETEFRILCPNEKIGALIGKGGARIKALRLDCKSKIKIEDEVKGSDERVIYICSTSKKDPKLPRSVCPAQEALLRVHAIIIADDEDEGHPESVTARLLVPSVQIGRVLGKGGKIIEQMRQEIPCQIRVLPKDQLPACGLELDELVQISGNPILVEKALYAVSTRLYERPLRERPGGQSQGRTSMSSITEGGGLYSASGYNGSLLAPTPVGSSMFGMGGYPYSYGSYGSMGYGGGWSSVPGPLMGSGITNGEGGTEEEFVLRILCPNDRIGIVIGKGGAMIKKLREESKARIQVCDLVPGADERVIEITSTEVLESFRSTGIEAAMLVHRRLMEIHADKEKDSSTFSVRLLVPTSSIGCLLGKGGSIITEMRQVTKAKIRIPPKEELPKCANENDDLVQVTGDEHVVNDAFLQILRRLRANLFKGHEADVPLLPGMAYGTLPPTYGLGRFDASIAAGGMYPLTNVGYGDYGSYGVSAASAKRRKRQS